MRYLITFAYDGSKYHGYQKQIHDNSVQEELETALTTINSGKFVLLCAAGRTDAGVHAFNQCAHFDLDKPIPTEKLKKSLNAIINSSFIEYLKIGFTYKRNRYRILPG